MENEQTPNDEEEAKRAAQRARAKKWRDENGKCRDSAKIRAERRAKSKSD
jgi:hypothetical protein